MLTNLEVLKVNQHSTNNRQLWREKNLIVWAADVPGSDEKYVALSNAQSKGDSVDFSSAQYVSPVIAGAGNSQEITLSVKQGKRLALFVKDGGDGLDFDHAVWVDPVLSGPKGELELTDLEWVFADAGWGAPHVNRTCEDQPLIVNGAPVTGIGTHADSVILYDLPEGYDTFSTKGVMTNRGSVVFGVAVDRGDRVIEDFSEVRVDFSDLGLSGKERVRDLWKQEDLGEFAGSFGRKLPLHGAGLFRLTPTR